MSATVPFAGGPYADARVTLTFSRKLFVMAGIGRTVPGVFPGPAGTPSVRYVWGFGWAGLFVGSLLALLGMADAGEAAKLAGGYGLLLGPHSRAARNIATVHA